MYPTDSKNGPLKLNPFVTQKTLDHNIMLKTIQNLCYNKTNAPFNMTSPFLVDNILHQQKTVNFHNQYLNQQIENYVLQRQSYSRENSPEAEDNKVEEDETNRNEESIEESKIDDEDSKSRDDDFTAVKNEQVFYNNDYYRGEERSEKEVLNIPNLARRCHGCGSFDCPPFSCKKSGLRRLEELEKRFNLHSYQENSGDEAEIKEKAFSTDDLVRSCDEFTEQKKPTLKFSVSAILGDREESGRSSNVNGRYLFTLSLLSMSDDSDYDWCEIRLTCSCVHSLRAAL